MHASMRYGIAAQKAIDKDPRPRDSCRLKTGTISSLLLEKTTAHRLQIKKSVVLWPLEKLLYGPAASTTHMVHS